MISGQSPVDVYGKINNLISFIMYLFLLSKSCFLLLLLKTRSCTEYTVKVVSFEIPVGFNLQWYNYMEKEDGRTAPGVCGNGSVPLSHSGDVVTRIGIHTLTWENLVYAIQGRYG